LEYGLLALDRILPRNVLRLQHEGIVQ
jgi:hypothetical protein